MSQGVRIPRIKTMSAMLANQIAAGEVVERPASIVKELLENALDADATRITMDIENAGTTLIRVSDNGHGIHPDDMALALQRHATAKLQQQAELESINSLGFRGEALPSISSVSDTVIVSRIAGESEARRASSNADGSLRIAPAAHPVGTTVEVSALFHRLPARKKYLKSERTELLHIQEIARRLALSRFDFNLEVRHNKRQLLSCRGGLENPAQRISPVMGRSFSDNAIEIDSSADGMRLWGWLGLGQLSRSSTDRQYLYLNRRVIYDRRLAHAIRLACEERLLPGRFPSYVLYLEMDSTAVDVNVHPAKHEVRFRRARDVHDFVYAAVHGELRRQGPGIDLSPDDTSLEQESMVRDDAETGNWGRKGRDINRSLSTTSTRAILAGSPGPGTWGRIIACIEKDILVCIRNESLLLINLLEVKRFLASERLGKREKLIARPLLVPVNIATRALAEADFEKYASLLSHYSLDLVFNGPGSCRVRAIPQLLEDADIASLVNAMLDVEISTRPEKQVRADFENVMLEHIQIPSVDNPAGAEVRTLLKQLEASVPNSSAAQHPPLWYSMDASSLRKILQDSREDP